MDLASFFFFCSYLLSCGLVLIAQYYMWCMVAMESVATIASTTCIDCVSGLLRFIGSFVVYSVSICVFGIQTAHLIHTCIGLRRHGILTSVMIVGIKLISHDSSDSSQDNIFSNSVEIDVRTTVGELRAILAAKLGISASECVLRKGWHSQELKDNAATLEEYRVHTNCRVFVEKRE
eukprot:778672_1